MKIALGGAQFGMNYGIANSKGQISKSEAQAILLKAGEKGVTLIDSAIAYGNCESILGELGVSKFDIVTKLPSLPRSNCDVNKFVHASILESLSNLKIRSLHGLLLHNSSDLLGDKGEQLAKSLLELKKDGLVKKIGISVYSPKELDLIIPNFDLDLVQAPYNLLDQRLVKSGWLSRLVKLGVEVHSRSVFLQGLLLLSRESIPVKFSQWMHIFDDWHRWLRESTLSPVQACLSLPLSCEGISKIIIGVDSLNQLNQIMDMVGSDKRIEYPNLSCDDEDLLNPFNWGLMK